MRLQARYLTVMSVEQGSVEMPNNISYDSETRTRTWDCDRCGAAVSSWRGRDTACEQCNAQYNGSGQRLRSDWPKNPSSSDEDTGDLEGYEIASLREESGQ